MEDNERIVAQIQAGDTAAIESLWTANKGLVAYVARRYYYILQRRADLDIEDLIQAGYFGLHNAAEKYDNKRDMAFSSYAIFHITREMRRTLGILTSKRDPNLNAIPLDAPISADNDDTTLIDIIAAPESDESPLERDELQSEVRAAVGRMKNYKARRAIEECYFENRTETQQAETEGISDGAISERLYKGYRELYNDPILSEWAIDYDYVNIYRHKGVAAFKSSFSSVVEDIVIQASEQHSKRAALFDALGDLV